MKSSNGSGRVIEWDGKGDCLQGDVCIFRCPEGFQIDKSMEHKATAQGQLILAEGEVTGHHHAIWLRNGPVMFRDDGIARAFDGLSGDNQKPAQAMADIASVIDVSDDNTNKAKLYVDQAAVQRLVQAGELTTNRLAIAFMEVTSDYADLSHDEHDTIRIPKGLYYVGRQREFSGAEERRVQD